MSEQHPSPNSAPTHPDVRFENPAFSTRGVLLVAAILVAFLLVAHVVLYALFGLLKDERDALVKRPLVAPAVQAERPQFLPKDLTKADVPVLQVEEVHDLAALQRRDAERLHSYGWVDRKRGIIHMPIDVALKQVLRDPQAAAARGLKARALPEGKP